MTTFGIAFKLQLIFFVLACSREKRTNEEYRLRTMMKSFAIDSSYTFCDPTAIGEETCYFDYAGKHYLKKEKLFFSDAGVLDKVRVLSQKGLLNIHSMN